MRATRKSRTIGQIPAEVILVQSEAEVDTLTLPVDTPVAYITRTTLSVDDTRGIIEALQRRFTDLVGPDTRDICYATQNRQAAVRELSEQVDVLLVVGATNSSNSNRLREIGTESGVPSYLVADGSEVKAEWFANAKPWPDRRGVRAEEMVEDVIGALRALGPVDVTTMAGREEKSNSSCRRSSRKLSPAKFKEDISCLFRCSSKSASARTSRANTCPATNAIRSR